MDLWIDIFKGGPQTDSAGRTQDGDRMIESALALFDASEHEPPLVIGHPAENAPAYGWVAELRKIVRDGVAVLQARVKDVAPQFADMVRKGLFRKRSASFYPDGTLRHIGFLGAMPPAVKGLADVSFTGPPSEAVTIDFMEEKTMWEDIKQFLGLARASGWDPIRGEALDATAPPTSPVTFSEADLETAKAEAARRARAEAAAEFAEQTRESAQLARKQDLESRIDSLAQDGRLPPALALKAKALIGSLAGQPSIEFADGLKSDPADMFIDILGQLPVQGLFTNFSGRAVPADSYPDQDAARAATDLGRLYPRKKET